RPIVITIVKEKTSWINIPVCLQSETTLTRAVFSYFSSLDFWIRDIISPRLDSIFPVAIS
ncbi:hypothetical protein, partial [Streptococcus agalactiae]